MPEAQTIDADHFDDLVAVALSAAPGVTWEGSAWSPGQDIPQDSQLRYALLTPRLVAPHGNSSVDAVSATEAIALVTAVRLGDINHRYNDAQPLLDSQLSLRSDDRRWNLFGALLRWIESGTIDDLRDLETDDGPPDLRAAHIAALSAALFEEGAVREAVEILEAALNSHDDYNPVDHAWLTLHLARNLIQIGDLTRAFDLAIGVALIGQVAGSDPTARFLAGIAADMIFSLSGWRAGDIESTIKARDTAASWWRSQTMTSGLAKHLEEAFKSWAEDKSVTFGASDETWIKLRSATLISGFAADTSNWRYESALLAQHILMLELSTGQAADALNLLRVAGLEKELKLVVNRMLERGPTEPLMAALSQVNLEKSTRDSLRTDLELLGLAGSLMSTAAADNAIGWLLNELLDPMARAESLGLRFLYTEQLVTAVARLYIASSTETQALVRTYVSSLPAIEDQSVAHNYAGLLDRIDHEEWTDDQVTAIKSRFAGDNFELKDAFERVVASRDETFRSALADRIKAGDAQALSSWGDVRDLPAAAVAGMIHHTAEAVRQELAGVRAGMHGYGGPSPLRRLVLLNVWYPDDADWTPCIEALTEKNSGPNELAPGLELILSHAERIPDDAKEQLREPLQRLSSTAPDGLSMFSLFTKSDVRGDAALLLATFFPDEIPEEQLIELLRGTSDQIVAAVRMVSDRHLAADLPLLTILATNDNADVKAGVAAALADWVALGVGGPASLKLLKSILGEPGVRLAARVTSALAQQQQAEGADELLALLENHQSAIVRKHVQVIRQRWSDAGK